MKIRIKSIVRRKMLLNGFVFFMCILYRIIGVEGFSGIKKTATLGCRFEIKLRCLCVGVVSCDNKLAVIEISVEAVGFE